MPATASARRSDCGGSRTHILRILVASSLIAALWTAAPSSAEDESQALLAPPVAVVDAIPPHAGGQSSDLPVADARYLGSTSCAAASCHGAEAGKTLLRSAYARVQEHDPHARAGEVLRGERSQRMVQQLGYAEPAWRVDTCLRCHAPAGRDATDPALSRAISEGVGCEACHGPARDWIEPHRSYAWNWPAEGLSERRRTLGFVETKRLDIRAGLCADCHVGAPGQQVDHDLIAAGHPRLTFELAAYQDLLPAHWKRSDDHLRWARVAGDATARFEMATWLAGQLAGAERELTLLRHAAEHPERPWPELSQFDCYACHQDVIAPLRSERNPQSLGRAAWGSWTISLLAHAPVGSRLRDDDFQRQLASIKSQLESFSADRAEIARQAEHLQLRLFRTSWSELARESTFERMRLWRNTLLEQAPELSRRNWDSSAQLYLAMVAFEHAQDARDVETRDSLFAIRQGLSFPSGSPQRKIAIFDSPRYGEADVAARLDQAWGEFAEAIRRRQAAAGSAANDAVDLFLTRRRTGLE